MQENSIISESAGKLEPIDAEEAAVWLLRPGGYLALRVRPMDPGIAVDYLSRLFADPAPEDTKSA